MATFLASIDIMPNKELLDPQGKTVAKNLKNIDIHAVSDVRIGKHIEMRLEAKDQSEAERITEYACKQLLANTIMESYSYSVKTA